MGEISLFSMGGGALAKVVQSVIVEAVSNPDRGKNKAPNEGRRPWLVQC
jgi:hypothetical protein